MKRSLFLILFFVVLCVCSTICAQSPISIYEGQMSPHTLADWNLKGPVKTVSMTSFIRIKEDSTFHQQSKTILEFDSVGRLTTETMIGWGAFEDKDTVVEYYQHDSLNRLSVRFSTDISFRQDFVYDDKGNFIYCIYTRNNGHPKPSWRHYYDDKGRCIRREYIPGIDDKDLGYTIYQHFFQYDSMNHCIEKVTMPDGDTELVERAKYDVQGNITEKISYYGLWGGVDNLSQELYFYNEEGRLVKSQSFYDHVETNERFYEYNDLNQLIRVKTYDKEEDYLSSLYEMFYDQYGNCVESIMSIFLRDQSLGMVRKTTYEYEYADVGK